jgi:hypothetical protein
VYSKWSKGKAAPVSKYHAMRMYWGVEITPCILNLGTRERMSSQLHVPAALPPAEWAAEQV